MRLLALANELPYSLAHLQLVQEGKHVRLSKFVKKDLSAGGE